jgi:hypothetical protein
LKKEKFLLGLMWQLFFYLIDCAEKVSCKFGLSSKCDGILVSEERAHPGSF